MMSITLSYSIEKHKDDTVSKRTRLRMVSPIEVDCVRNRDGPVMMFEPSEVGSRMRDKLEHECPPDGMPAPVRAVL